MTVNSATHANVLELPTVASVYDKRPWRCLRDVVAAGHFKAEELRAQAEGRAVDIDRAMCGMVVCPFAWDTTENFAGQTAFVIFTSGEKFHFKSANLRRLCMRASAVENKNSKKKKPSRSR